MGQGMRDRIPCTLPGLAVGSENALNRRYSRVDTEPRPNFQMAEVQSDFTDRHDNQVRQFFAKLGPGVITGAADDDPSGISTYSSTGAALGLTQLWTVFLTFPLMSAVQLMCARLGLVTGEGLGATIRRRYSPLVLWFACSLLVVANVVNIGADLAGMAEALEMVTPVRKWVWLPILAISIVLALIFWSYRKLARIFKWLTLSLFAYVFAAFLARPDWPKVLEATFIPKISLDPQYLSTLVAILGTTITPYMFFWQSAQEVEEERAHGRKTLEQRRGATKEELRDAGQDVLVGMGWAGTAMYFIILTTATTLHKPGAPAIETAQQAAEALRPLAGQGAYLLFALGIVATGILAVPVLAGSAAYAIAEAMHWRGSLDSKPKVGGKFYIVLALAVLVGLALDALNISAVKALLYAAIVNGVLAPPLVFIVTRLTCDPKVMGEHANGRLLAWLGYAAALIMSIAAIAMIVTSL